MGQQAYEYDFNAARKRRAPQQQKKTQLRVAKGGKRRLNPVQAAMHHAVQLVALAMLVGFSVGLLWSESQLVELNSKIQSAQAELTSEQSQYTYYASTLNSKTSITSIEDTASRLGLMKIDQSQITYVRLNSASVLERKESTVRKWTDFIHDGVLTALNTADALKQGN